MAGAVQADGVAQVSQHYAAGLAVPLRDEAADLEDHDARLAVAGRHHLAQEVFPFPV